MTGHVVVDFITVSFPGISLSVACIDLDQVLPCRILGLDWASIPKNVGLNLVSVHSGLSHTNGYCVSKDGQVPL